MSNSDLNLDSNRAIQFVNSAEAACRDLNRFGVRTEKHHCSFAVDRLPKDGIICVCHPLSRRKARDLKRPEALGGLTVQAMLRPCRSCLRLNPFSRQGPSHGLSNPRSFREMLVCARHRGRMKPAGIFGDLSTPFAPDPACLPGALEPALIEGVVASGNQGGRTELRWRIHSRRPRNTNSRSHPTASQPLVRK
jgi:hypothetical protein